MTNLLLLPLYPTTQLPSQANPNDACRDVYAHSIEQTEKYREYGLGFATQIPDGRCALVYARSSLSKTDLILANHVGVIDAGYRGEWKMRFRIHKPHNAGDNREPDVYTIGDRIGQFMLVPVASYTTHVVSTLDESARGSGGFGSSGT